MKAKNKPQARAALGAAFACALALAAPMPKAAANDSSVELAVGGVTFAQSPDVSMEEETLTITPETVTVNYRFLNQTQAPVTLNVGFPLPDLDLSDQDSAYAIPGADPVNFVDFKTRIDGKPIKFDVVQRAKMGARDVTAAVRASGLPIALIGADTQQKIAAITPEARAALIDSGLLIPAGTSETGETLYGPAWTATTAFTRKQIFPPGSSVNVEHRYRTSLGASQDTALRKALRDADGMGATVERYRKDYCLPDDFFRGLDKIAGSEPTNTARLQERRIAYVLKTGANWSGPIKNFHLIVDKGKSDRLVSFCFDNVKKISPTAFEAKLENFTPAQDLKILLIGKY
ncbi:DUF4424 domain-containing protein [Methylocella silvestris]|uniref:DUF4424 domain-containing protein n=1 Tax=Methylocella silvestris TaxID=199596 RepID=A0A2J7TH75_METSI|nr:DUF4424 domain-containing protein [Methylocella silvestris]PNG26106.1 hypothetical protein CR492_09630 [Methylocella silvestris]